MRTEEERELARLEGILVGRDWNEVVVPRIRREIDRQVRALIVGGLEAKVEERVRGRIEALEWFLKAPLRELEEHTQRKDEEARKQAEDEATERILSGGFRAVPIDEET